MRFVCTHKCTLDFSGFTVEFFGLHGEVRKENGGVGATGPRSLQSERTSFSDFTVHFARKPKDDMKLCLTNNIF